jgi:hypothetical protein
MNTESDRNTAAEPEFIPNPPGGGSWRWEGGQWLSNEPVIATPAEPAPTTEE